MRSTSFIQRTDRALSKERILLIDSVYIRQNDFAIIAVSISKVKLSFSPLIFEGNFPSSCTMFENTFQFLHRHVSIRKEAIYN